MSAPLEPPECVHCGARAGRAEARFCEYCGTELPRTPAAPPPDPIGDAAARFRALAAHPDLPRLLAATPDVPELSGRTLTSFLALAGFAAVGLFVTLLFFTICPPLGLLPLALVGFGVYSLSRRLAWTARTPLEAVPALVVDLRARLQTGAESSPAHARHHVTLQLEDGRRVEVECFPSAAEGRRVGDLGVAYLKGDRLASFERLEV